MSRSDRRSRNRLLRLLVLPAAMVCLAAVEPPPAPDRPLADPAQEARAQALFDDIRCVVCQHEGIADSPAGIAADMRGLVREQVAAGQSDRVIRQDLIRRYGDFVLFKPPVRPGTWMLWFGPLAGLIAVAAGLWAWSRKRAAVTRETPLTAEEEARLSQILDGSTDRRDPDAKPSEH